MQSDLLQEAKEHLRKARSDAGAGGLVSGHWRNQADRIAASAENFTSVDQAIRFAQIGRNTGFDHRLTRTVDPLLEAKVRFKLNQIALVRQNFSPKNSSFIRESPYSDPDSIIEVDGVPYSNMFLTHLYFYQRVVRECLFQTPFINVLEIGGGYGSLARIFALHHPYVRYTIIDLPESMFFSEVFLRANFAQGSRFPIKTHYVEEGGPADISGSNDAAAFPRVRFVPAHLKDALAGERFDLVLNTFSLQEMTYPAVLDYMDFIQEKISTNYFYSCNYFMNPYAKFGETSYQEGTPTALALDRWWDPLLFQINPPAVRVDADTRNWLEVLLKRVDRETVTQIERQRLGERLLRELPLHAPGSNEWFAKVWTAAWTGSAAACREMLRGIEIFNAAGPSVNSLYREHAAPEAAGYGEHQYFQSRLAKPA